MAKKAALVEMVAPSGDARIGQSLLGRYEIVRLIAEGGMGTVYAAVNRAIGRRFALKFLRRDLLDDPKTLARFQQEAVASGALEHENICGILDVGEDPDGEPCLVMEYLEGKTLAQLLEAEGPLPVARAVDLVRQVCRGLQVAHAAGVIHRDLKPKNLFLCRHSDGRDLVKIVDFGIAKVHGPDVTRGDSTTTGAAFGTPHYMSPEQARGEKNLDLRADIYALGVILYELLSGERPHPGESYNAIIYHILSKEPVPLREHRPEIPESLSRLIDRAMASDPNDRFESAHELERALAAHGPASRVVLAADADTLGSPQTSSVRGTPGPRRTAVAFGLGVLLAGGTSWLVVAPSAAPALQAEPSATADFSSSAPAPLIPSLAVAAAVPAAASAAPPPAAPPLTASAAPRRHALTPAKAATPAPPKPIGSFDWSNPYQ